MNELITKLKQYKEELKTISKERINNQKKFLTIETYICKLNNNSLINREKLLKNNTDGSASIIFPLTSDNKIILVMEPRVFTKETVDIGFPSGYIENGEDSLITAKRELLEETGYTTDNLIKVGSFYQDQGISAAFNHYFIAFNCQKVQNQNLDKDEIIKIIEVTFEELQELINIGWIKGLNSAYLIEKGKEYIRVRKNG